MTIDRIEHTGFAAQPDVRARGRRSAMLAQLITSAALALSIAIAATALSIGIARAHGTTTSAQHPDHHPGTPITMS